MEYADMVPTKPSANKTRALLEKNGFKIIGKKLGEGAFGTVHFVHGRLPRSTPRKHGRYAAKVVCVGPADMTADGTEPKEVRVHRTVGNEKACISRLLHVCGPLRADDPMYALIFELAHCNLQELFNTYIADRERLPLAFLWSLFRDLTEAVQHCSACGVHNGDLNGACSTPDVSWHGRC